jgi:hypothetical protein
MKKKKNPQDATLRNIRALKKHIEILEVVLGNHLTRIVQLERSVMILQGHGNSFADFMTEMKREVGKLTGNTKAKKK